MEAAGEEETIATVYGHECVGEDDRDDGHELHHNVERGPGRVLQGVAHLCERVCVCPSVSFRSPTSVSFGRSSQATCVCARASATFPHCAGSIPHCVGSPFSVPDPPPISLSVPTICAGTLSRSSVCVQKPSLFPCVAHQQE